MKNLFKKKLSLILVCVLFAALTLNVGCGKKAVVVNPDVNTTIEGCTLGEGNTEFAFVVVDGNGAEQNFTIKTNETTVGAALLAVNLIAGEDSEYGLYVKTVNGIVADWDVDQTYWAFYINDEYAMTGVDSTDIEAGATYKFVVSK